MSNFVDDAARILANPTMRRRQVFRLIWGALLGGIAATQMGCNLSCGDKWQCPALKTCCPKGYGYNCSGSCYSNGCPPNLEQTDRCY